MTNLFVNFWLACVKVLFTFLHLVYSGFQYFDMTWSLFKRKWEIVYSLKGIDSNIYVSRFVTGLETCPSHLAVIVGNDAIRCQDFTNLVIWCLAAGISFLTVYDHKGVMKERESKLYKYFIENTTLKQSQVIFRNLPVTNGTGRNGYKNKIYVSVLSSSDGKDAFVELVQEMGHRILQSNIKASSLTQDVISEELFVRSKYPDPDLAIVATSEMCTYGYPPWNIRLTEFIKVPSLEEINVKEFCDVLRKYSAREKRLGK